MISLILFMWCLWSFGGFAAWVATRHWATRRYYRPIDGFYIFLCVVFTIFGPLSWFPAVLIKEITELE